MNPHLDPHESQIRRNISKDLQPILLEGQNILIERRGIHPDDSPAQLVCAFALVPAEGVECRPKALGDDIGGIDGMLAPAHFPAHADVQDSGSRYGNSVDADVAVSCYRAGAIPVSRACRKEALDDDALGAG